MATQTGSIDLTTSNSVKLAAEAGWQSDLNDYYTKSEIDVTVDGINSTVSTKVGEDEVISSINQSAESVSINANKINLQGAVTISDLSSDAQSATLNSNISVGGRNLALDSKLMSHDAVASVPYAGMYSTAPKVERSDGFVAVAPKQGGNWTGLVVYMDSLGLAVGDLVAFSCLYEYQGCNANLHFYAMSLNSSGTRTYPTFDLRGSNGYSGNYHSVTQLAAISSSNPSGKVWVVAKWSQAAQDTIDAGGHVRFTFQVSNTTEVTSGGSVHLYATKLEKGNIATDWTPALEDMAVAVGGRNLLAYSGTGKNWSYSTFVDGVYTRSTTATSESYVIGRTAAPLELGETYTLSAWMKTNGQVSSVDMYLYDHAVKTIRFKKLDEITTEWALYTFTVTMPDSWVSGTNTVDGWDVRFDNNGSKTSGTEAILYVKEPKLEVGNVATDWSPAPEDVDRAVSDAAKTATSYVTDINSNGITVHPSRSDYATNGGRAVINGDGLTVYLGSDDVASYGASARIGKANSDRVTVDSTDGITIYKGNSKRLQTTANGIDVYGSDGTTSIASFGATARIGKSNGTRVIIDTSEVKIIPSNKTSNALTFTATDDSARIDYGSNYLSIGDVEFGYDCALGVLGDVWVSSGGSLNVGSSAAYGNPKFTVTSGGAVSASGAIYATDDPTDTSDPSLVAGLVGTSSFIVLRADVGSAGNRWRFNKAGRDIGYYNGTDWDTVCPMPAMTAAISGGTDKSLTTSYANLTLGAVTTVASALTISGGGVKCTKAGRVMISGAAYFEGVSAGNVCNIRVLIGSTVAALVSDRAYSDRCQMVIPPRITTVAENDVLYMAVANTSAAAGSVKGTRTQTWLTVQYVAYN